MDEDESLVERVEVAGSGPVGTRDGTLLVATAEDERERERECVCVSECVKSARTF